ncbi:ABC-type transport system ATP-binding protein [Gracilibacillus halophilus YIM-C55.5]|uniref:ABC-type transport system ATP-binding protein n=1 Tax=Gracilibacillus halophilus YIM-C55.5 TaxID=1308866 RepID=N4WUP6_9BACI|nr:ABC-type transport system ATP-binding protein [Gracilibacillus halophilus YIM-C55.5]
MFRVKNIKKYYGNQQVLGDVSFHVSEGICYGLVGPNGAGKSTLMKIIASIIHEYHGEIQFSPSHMTIGYVPQEIALEETVTARDNLLFFGKLYGLRGQALRNRMNEVLSEIGLTDRGKEKVKTFSGGMKRRLNIGCAIMHQPDLIIMDEPTVGIDPQSRHYIFQMIERFKQENHTIIYASHYMEEIEQLCDETAFMDRGKVVENDRIDHLLEKHAVPSIFVKGRNCLPEHMAQDHAISETDGGYLITTNQPLDMMKKVIEAGNENDREIERLELVKPRLADIFFSLTGSKLRD